MSTTIGVSGGMLKLHPELIQLSPVRDLVREQRLPAGDQPLHHLVDLQPRQARRLALDQLLI